MDAKLKRRMSLLDDLLDYAIRSACRFFACNGPEAPIRAMITCSRCACIHRAIQMGLVKKVDQSYARSTPNGDVFVQKDVLEQFSAVDGSMVD